MIEPALHPATWWVWAIAMAIVAAMVSNPLVLLIEAAVLLLVVVVVVPDPLERRPMRLYLAFGLWAIGIRVVIGMAFGARVGGTVLFTLPSFGLPSWAAGVTVGGPVTVTLVMSSFVAGLRLAVIVCAFGAANTLGSPQRLLRSMPGFLAEFGVAMGVALLFAPELVSSIADLRAARRLRGRPTRGVAGLRGMLVPALEGALDRAVHLAASMDARGFGRVDPTSGRRHRRRVAVAASAISLGVVGVFVMLSGLGPSGLGLVLGAVGIVGAVVALAGSDRSTVRTRYRQLAWTWLDGLVMGCALVALGSVVAVSHLDPSALRFVKVPLAWPALPVVAVTGLLVALLPALVVALKRRTSQLVEAATAT